MKKFKTENISKLCSNSEHADGQAPKDSLSHLTLHPAPGEMFSLAFTVMDELLNEIPATLHIKLTVREDEFYN